MRKNRAGLKSPLIGRARSPIIVPLGDMFDALLIGHYPLTDRRVWKEEILITYKDISVLSLMYLFCNDLI